MKYQPLEWTTLVNKLMSRDFDMLVIGGLADLDPDILYDVFHSKGGWNIGKCSFPELDKLLEEQRFTVDFEKRKEIVWKIQEILAEKVPLLNAVHQQFVFAYRVDKFAGWVVGPFMGPDNWFSYMNVYSLAINKPPKTTPKPSPATTPKPSPTTTTTTSPKPSPTTVTVPKTTAVTVTATATATAPGRTVTVTKTVEKTVTVTAAGAPGATVTKTVVKTVTVERGVPPTLMGVIALVVVVVIVGAVAVALRRR